VQETYSPGIFNVVKNTNIKNKLVTCRSTASLTGCSYICLGYSDEVKREVKERLRVVEVAKIID